MDDIPVSALDNWPKLFFEYGLFFITLVFILIVARGAGKSLQAAVDAKADEGTIRYQRRMNTGIWIFTCFLVLATCAWWIVRKDIESTKAFVVRLDISDAQPTDILEPFSDNMFYRNQDPLDAARRKDTFVAVAEKPFRLKQPLVIIHKKGTDAAVAVRYTVPVDEAMLKERNAEYKLVLNPQKGKYELVAASAAGPSTASSIISSAFAMQPSVISGERITLPPSAVQSLPQQAPLRAVRPSADVLPSSRVEADAATVLLNETSSVYRQIQALDALIDATARDAPPDFFKKRAGTDETLLSYLITLSHHQDKLLRYKAQTLLQRADAVGAVAKVATGKSRQAQDVDRRILASLEPSDWNLVEQRLRKEGAIVADANVARRGGASPVPSATVDGTQYYGLTTWAKLNGPQASCLANVVYRQNDVQGARPDEALGFVQSRNGFAFTFRTKSEAIVFADAAQKCGASTQFVYKGDPKLAQFRD